MTSPRRISLLDACEAFASGVGMIILTPRVWLWSLVPAAMLVILLTVFTCMGVWASAELAERIFGAARETWGSVGYWTVAVLLSIVAFLAAVVAALGLAQPLSGFALEKIVQASERQSLGGRCTPGAPVIGALWLNFRCVAFAMVPGLSALAVLFAVNLAFPPAAVVTVPLKFIVLAWMLAWDLLDYPMGMRWLGIRDRLRWIRRHFAAFTLFGLFWALAAVVPGVVLLLLPMGVAGATKLLLQDDPRPPG